MTKVKICGLTNSKDAVKAVQLGAWALGFNFYKKSPRYLGAYKAQKIIAQLPPFVTPVGVFVNLKEGAVKQILDFCHIQTVQFHGDESAQFCKRFKKNYKVIKAIRIAEDLNVEALKAFEVDAFLLDTHDEKAYGGTGKTFDWTIARKVKNLNVPIILSGGLHYNNVVTAIEEVKPYAVDTCSGVETSPGVKNEQSMREFIRRVIM
jgi:phosphoribosylanthranilate isomerase